MNAALPAVVENLAASGYSEAFERAFGPGGITADRMARALEQFLLTQVSYGSRFDAVMNGTAQFTAEEQRGFELFNTERDPRRGQFGADCFHCHGGALFTDFQFHNNGLDGVTGSDDAGRAAVTGRASDRLKFKTPSLRNVAVTGPYMHDGRFQTLEQAVAHYSSGVHASPTLDPNLARHPEGGLQLSADDQRALVAFLRTLTDPRYAAAARESVAHPVTATLAEMIQKEP
jgi:cytochrome c peroxidase